MWTKTTNLENRAGVLSNELLFILKTQQCHLWTEIFKFICIAYQGDETKIAVTLFKCLHFALLTKQINVFFRGEWKGGLRERGEKMKRILCVRRWQLLIHARRVLLKTHTRYQREGVEWSTTFLFMAWFSLRESLLAVCGSLPVVIVCYQPSDTQTWEVLQGSPTHKHCSGYGFRSAN